MKESLRRFRIPGLAVLAIPVLYGISRLLPGEWTR